MASVSAQPKRFIDHLKTFGLGLLLLALGTGLIIFLQIPYFSAWSSGGTTWDSSHFAAPPPEETIHFLTVEAMVGGDSGFYEETRLNGIIPVGTDYFGFLLIDENTLLITKTGDVMPDFETPTSFTGSLKNFDSDVRTQVIEEIRKELPADMRDMIYPRLLDITEFENKAAWIFGSVMCALFVIIGVVLILRSLGGMVMGNRRVERSI